MEFIVVGVLVFIVAVAMTMVGKGGGNFYVVILAIASIPMHEAAATGQFILFFASAAALFIFQKKKTVSWPLAVIIGLATSISALGGGFFSHHFSSFTLKMIFAFLLVLSGVVMLLPAPEPGKHSTEGRPGILSISSGEEVYRVNLWLVVPVTVLTGFCSGMVGVSGGSFLVPLMVLACGVPMHTAVGTSSILIAATAGMGFLGHAAQGDFNPGLAVPLAFLTVIGGLIGGRFALKTRPANLKRLFAYTNWIAVLFMLYNALQAEGIL